MNKAEHFKRHLPFLNVIPQFLTKLPYWVALKNFQLKLRPLGVRVWPRNSYAQGRMTLALSDLDLTFYTSRQNFLYQKTPITSIIEQLRQRYPYTGEINCYFEDDLLSYKNIANVLEIERDPILMSMLSPLKLSHYDTIAFLNHMLISDLHQLKVNILHRQKKWRPYIGHFSSVEEFKQAFLLALEPHPFDRDEYNQFWHQVWLGDSDLDRKLELIHMPHRFDVLTHDDDFDLSPDEKNILAAHVNWEIWGLMAQRPLNTQVQVTIQHLERLAALSQRYHLRDQYIQSFTLSEDMQL